MRGAGDRLLLGVLVLDAVLLAAVELLFLPLRVKDLGLHTAPGWLPDSVVTWPVPLSLLLALVATPWLVRSAGELSPRVAVAAAPLLAWLLALAILGLAGPGGDRLLTNDWRSLALFAVGAVTAAVALGRVLGRPPDAQPPWG
ncbi:hypothetical protein GCM10012275_12490 [Longimycelium tulufanense]|uniref:Uncharacterized protein n=1 Tax=Longimycelium tulufanense TaxID=907463 RepID=A0A8J3C6U1_9PSEU|nr:hypothetical protein [Longimycelium tulufanense]GGM43025.1 hypothetical protein GCM10012275_12490 [Longimycelium tulufanense]